jgi:hypothetical protein
MARLPGTVPELIPVEDSSNVRAIGYDLENKYLYVQFHPESESERPPVYRYISVPEQVYRRFMKAPSKGMFVWRIYGTNIIMQNGQGLVGEKHLLYRGWRHRKNEEKRRLRNGIGRRT